MRQRRRYDNNAHVFACECVVLVSMAYWRGLWGAGISVLMMDNDVDEHLYGVSGLA